MKRLFFLFFIIAFLYNPAYLSAALWEYSANGEVYNQETDTRYDITGNMIIDETLRLWSGSASDPTPPAEEIGYYQYSFHIPQYSIHLTEQWGSEQHYFYGSSGNFYMEFSTFGLSDLMWFLDGSGRLDNWIGENFRFYNDDGTPYGWHPEEYAVLAPKIRCSLFGHPIKGIAQSGEYIRGDMVLTRTGSVQVPEPATGILFAIGIASAIFWRRKLIR